MASSIEEALKQKFVEMAKGNVPYTNDFTLVKVSRNPKTGSAVRETIDRLTSVSPVMAAAEQARAIVNGTRRIEASKEANKRKQKPKSKKITKKVVKSKKHTTSQKEVI